MAFAEIMLLPRPREPMTYVQDPIRPLPGLGLLPILFRTMSL